MDSELADTKSSTVTKVNEDNTRGQIKIDEMAETIVPDRKDKILVSRWKDLGMSINFWAPNFTVLDDL